MVHFHGPIFTSMVHFHFTLSLRTDRLQNWIPYFPQYGLWMIPRTLRCSWSRLLVLFMCPFQAALSNIVFLLHHKQHQLKTEHGMEHQMESIGWSMYDPGHLLKKNRVHFYKH